MVGGKLAPLSDKPMLHICRAANNQAALVVLSKKVIWLLAKLIEPERK
jgi:hypothetical protein